MRPASTILAIAAALAGTACAGGTASAPRAQPPRADIVQSLVGDAACESDSQCATIGVGAKACGGPAAYIAWSRLRTDPAALQAAVDEQAAEQQRANVAAGRVSNCAVVPDPGAWCDGRASTGRASLGVCRLQGHTDPTRPGISPSAR